MKIILGGCIVQCFFKRGYAAWMYDVDQDDEATAVLPLVVSNQILPFVSRRVLRLEERTPGWDSAIRLTRTHAVGREPSVGNTICLPSRALRPSSRALLACSIRSRQSGSCEGGRGRRAASSRLRASSPECALGSGAIFGSSLVSIYQICRWAWASARRISSGRQHRSDSGAAAASRRRSAAKCLACGRTAACTAAGGPGGRASSRRPCQDSARSVLSLQPLTRSSRSEML